MDNRRITVLLAATPRALAGLLAILVLHNHNTAALKEEQLRRGVKNALFAVSDRVELEERMRVLQEHEGGQRLLTRLDSLRRDARPRDALEPLGAGLGDPHVKAGPEMVHRGEAELVADLVRGILAAEMHGDVRERLNASDLSAHLRNELRAIGIEDSVLWGVYAADGSLLLTNGDGVSRTEELEASPHRERLFRHDLAGPEYHLHLLVPEGTGTSRGLILLLLVSALFMLVIAGAFGSTLRAVLYQKRINDIRNDLVNNLTHELKTPISTIALACEALADPSLPKTEEQVRTFTAMIRDENKRLGGLVENVLQSAVLDSGHMVLKRVELDLHALVRDVARSSAMQVSRRNGRIDLDLQAEIHHLFGDRTHLTNVLYNLIDNAVKYTEQEPRVRIATRSDDRGITLSVIDNGIGIPANEQRKIFDRLYRVPTGNVHNAKGYGLGLSYVRTVVERHGGRIDVQSTPGRGSTFRIFVPFEHVRTHQAAAGGG